MSFGKSRAKRMSVDSPKITFRDMRGRRRGGRELHEDQGVPQEPEKVPGAGRPHSQGRLLNGPPGTGKTLLAAPSRERRACRSSRSRARSSSRCSSASAPPAYATCSSRPSRTRPGSSSSTRSTPSAATAAPASAAGTTSASKRSIRSSAKWTASGQEQHHRAGRHQPARHARSRAASTRPIRPPYHRRPARTPRPREIFEVHTAASRWPRNRVDALAGQTPGFTGADIPNLVNEAALLAARTARRRSPRWELEEGDQCASSRAPRRRPGSWARRSG